ncbi:diguanylate cyclase (GGDEF) domain-containing protein [Cohaesibacter sp. ES.047]|uniref:GGDEF domain-containing protein n=1 Tax=Cohaesibacter sp. ES.047 TaxID=1798205 RepID=UPI000BBFA0B0|nr:GGDEF domain-containing protein [Cohaesibacter sp. ES.047]SNY92082.1 diguanylate cyclase (GGDEF) domain-containing protein [Cohaesibacter sp. ES.047]
MTALPRTLPISLDTIFEEMSDGVIIIDPAGQVQYRNKAINDLPSGLEERILSFCSMHKCGCGRNLSDELFDLASMSGWSVSCHAYGDNNLLLVKYDNLLGRRIQSLRDDFSERVSNGVKPDRAALDTLRKHLDVRWITLGGLDAGSHSLRFNEAYDGQSLSSGMMPTLRCRDDFKPCSQIMVGTELETYLTNSSEVRAAGLEHVLGMGLKNSFNECVGYALVANDHAMEDLKDVVTLMRELALLYGLYIEVGSARTEALRATEDANTDVITEQGNRRAFENFIKECLSDMQNEVQDGGELSMFDPKAMRNSAIMIIDFDGFKRINDTLGHSEGDRALRLVAEELSRISADNRVFRLGGDEFVQVFPRAGSLDAEDLREQVNLIEQRIAEQGFSELGLSIGVVHFFESDGSLASLMALADARMYHDKRLRTLAFL